MKRLLTVLIATLCISTIVSASENGAEAYLQIKRVTTSSVVSLVRNYRLEPGFTIVSVGKLGLGLAKLITAAAETEEEKAILGVLDNLHKVVVVEYSEAAIDKRDDFNRKFSKLLESTEKIVELKDDGTALNIYGISDDRGETVSDVIVFVPQESALICLFGSISTAKIAELVNVAMEE